MVKDAFILMARFEHVVVGLLFIGFLHVSSSAQAPKSSATDNGLELVTVGQEVMSTGRRGAFRIYAASDGTKAEVSYVHFDTSQDAKRQTDQWLRLATKVNSKDERKDESGHLVGNRILARRQKADSGKEEFLIIRRDGTMCYFIRSSALSVAMRVEELIKNN